MLDRTIAPAAKAIGSIELIRPVHRTLSSGIELYAFNGGEQEVVRLEFLFRNTGWNTQNPALLLACNALLLEGTQSRSAAAIAEAFDYYGAFVNAEYGQNYSSIVLHCLSKQLDQVLPILAEVLNEANFAEQEVQTWQQNQGQKLKVNLQKNEFVARRHFSKSIWGEQHPYGYNNSFEDYQKLTAADLRAAYAKQYHAGNCLLIAAGKIDESVFTCLEKYFGSYRSAGKVQEEQFPIQGTSTLKQPVKGPQSLQAALRLGKRFINKTHPDLPAMQVLNTVLGGYFGSRLMSNIREDKGYTYGIGSGIASLQEGGFFYIASEVGANVAEATIMEIHKEIQRLQNELIPAEELNRVRNYMLGSYTTGIENIFSHADKFKGIHLFGLGYDHYENYLEVIRTVPATQLKDLANQYLAIDSLIEVVVV